MEKKDNVNSPEHYKRFRFECEPKDFTKYLPHPLACAVEYFIRAPYKSNELEDLQKAVFWLREFISTDLFWHREDGETCCRVMVDTPSLELSKYKAAAWGLASQCVGISYLFVAEKDPELIQEYGTKYLLNLIECRIEKMMDELSDTERGDQGFGSTGR